MLFFGLQVIAVVLAVFLHHGNGRAVTSTINNNIERMLDLAEEELSKVTNEMTTEREENPADVLRLAEPDSSSLEAVQSQFSSDNIIQPKDTRPVLRQKRSSGGPCTRFYKTFNLASGEVGTFPICHKVALTGSGNSINKYGFRKCEGINHDTANVRLANGSTVVGVFPRNCTCAV